MDNKTLTIAVLAMAVVGLAGATAYYQHQSTQTLEALQVNAPAQMDAKAQHEAEGRGRPVSGGCRNLANIIALDLASPDSTGERVGEGELRDGDARMRQGPGTGLAPICQGRVIWKRAPPRGDSSTRILPP